MRALSVKQPWASLIASGRKTIELRTWTTSYRGPILICAGKSFDARGMSFPDGKRGHALCVVELAEVRQANAKDAPRACFDAHVWSGVYAWELRDVRHVEPLSVLGRLSLFSVADELIRYVSPISRTQRTQHTTAGSTSSIP